MYLHNSDGQFDREGNNSIQCQIRLDTIRFITANQLTSYHTLVDCAIDSDIQPDSSKIAIFAYPPCINPPPDRGFPWDDLRKFFVDINGWPTYHICVETLPKISIAWVGCTNVTDRQTDGRQHTANVNASPNRFELILPITTTQQQPTMFQVKAFQI